MTTVRRSMSPTEAVSAILDELEWYASALKQTRERDQNRKRKRSECEAQRQIPSQP